MSVLLKWYPICLMKDKGNIKVSFIPFELVILNWYYYGTDIK